MYERVTELSRNSARGLPQTGTNMSTNTARPTQNPSPSAITLPPRVPLDRRVAVLSGVLLLLIALLGGWGYVGAVGRLVTEGDAARTAGTISGSGRLFALGVAALYVAALLDVVVAWALLRFFEPVNASLARLAAYLRLAYAAVFLVAIGLLAGVPGILAQDPGPFSTEQLQAQALGRIEAFHDVWFAGLVLFGAHLIILGLMVYGLTPLLRILGVLLVIAGAGYIFDTFYDLLRPGTTLTVSGVTFVGEFLLAVWLVARGGRSNGSGGSR